MLELNAKTTALVVIDLQEGILPFAGGPHTADEVVKFPHSQRNLLPP